MKLCCLFRIRLETHAVFAGLLLCTQNDPRSLSSEMILTNQRTDHMLGRFIKNTPTLLNLFPIGIPHPLTKILNQEGETSQFISTGRRQLLSYGGDLALEDHKRTNQRTGIEYLILHGGKKMKQIRVKR